MKTRARIIAAVLTASLLAGCGGSGYTPNTAAYVPPKQVLESVDAAYDTDYKKFTLPPKSALHLTEPEGVYRLTLEIINNQEDKDWEAQKSRELLPVFGVESGRPPLGTTIEAVVSGAYFIDEQRIEQSVTSLSATLPDETETLVLSPSVLSAQDEGAKLSVRRCESYDEAARQVLGGELGARAAELYIYRSGDDIGYGIELERSYKGVGLVHLYPLHPTLEQMEGSEALRIWQSYADFDSEGELVFFNSSPSMRAKRAEALESVVSFKGACDRLEEELAPRAAYEFDDVMLLYDTRADSSGGDLADIACRPKWFFVRYSRESSVLSMQYFTVDCESGEVEGVW